MQHVLLLPSNEEFRQALFVFYRKSTAVTSMTPSSPTDISPSDTSPCVTTCLLISGGGTLGRTMSVLDSTRRRVHAVWRQTRRQFLFCVHTLMTSALASANPLIGAATATTIERQNC